MLTEKAHPGEFLLSEAPGSLSRETITVAASQTLVDGQVLGKITRGAATVTPTAASGNTGTGSIGTVTADAGAPAGDYQVVIIEPGTNAGKFEVLKPDGTLDGTGTVAVAYNGSINFTLADATDFVSGDFITVNVAFAAGSGQYVMHDPEGTDGRQNWAGFLIGSVTTGVGETAKAVAIVRSAEVISERLAWDDQDTTEKAAALAQAAAQHVIAR